MFRERSSYTPTGNEEFVGVLADLNIPETFLSNLRKRHELRKRKGLQVDEGLSSQTTVQEPTGHSLNSPKRKRKNEPSRTAWVNF